MYTGREGREVRYYMYMYSVKTVSVDGRKKVRTSTQDWIELDENTDPVPMLHVHVHWTDGYVIIKRETMRYTTPPSILSLCSPHLSGYAAKE